MLPDEIREGTSGSPESRAPWVALGSRSKSPPGSESLPGNLLQIDLHGYRNPEALPPGHVLIVGSGQSGCQLAEELHEDGREVVLAAGKAAWAPRRIGDADLVWWLEVSGFLSGTVDSLPRRVRDSGRTSLPPDTARHTTCTCVRCRRWASPSSATSSVPMRAGTVRARPPVGLSGGEPRQEMNPWVQCRGYRDAIAFAVTIDGHDPGRIGIWGDSYSAGDTYLVAAADPRVKAVVAQCPVFGAAPPEFDPSTELFDRIWGAFDFSDVCGSRCHGSDTCGLP